MRVVKTAQMQLGETSIASIKFNPKSRDDIDQILKGLQYIYCQAEARQKLFSILEKMIPSRIDKNNGRPGMELWKVFVLAVLRLNLNWDYDRLLNMANHHVLIRQMLGHSDAYGPYRYELQTIKDNLKLLTPEILDELNIFVVNCGHTLVKKKDKDEQGNVVLKTRGDSFVVKTRVHFPTDINLLFDAMRKVMTLTGELFKDYGALGWRQYKYNLKKIKKHYRRAQRSKKSKARTAEETIKKTHQEYIELSETYLYQVILSLKLICKERSLSLTEQAKIEEIYCYINHAKRQMNQIDRRILQGEVIPHNEKVFSLFEPHTEWIMKGKAAEPVELGLRVSIIEDQYQFILHHRIMQKETDKQIAIDIVKSSKKKFAGIKAVSFDKGFIAKITEMNLIKYCQKLHCQKKVNFQM